MGLKSLANKAKGRRPIVEEEDSDFDPPLTKCWRPHTKKKSKLSVEEQMVEEISGKKPTVAAEVRTEVSGTTNLVHLITIDLNVFALVFFSVIDNIKKTLSESNQLVEICFCGVKTIDHKAIEDAFLGSRFDLDVVDSGRILNWSNTIVTKNPTLRDLKGKIFDLPLNKLKIKNMCPTDEERQKLELDGLFLDESIDFYLGHKTQHDDRGIAKQSFESGSSSKKYDSEDIDLMKYKFEMVISNQASLAEDFISLRCFVDLNFKSVMTVIKDIQEKVNAIHHRPSDEGKSSNELVVGINFTRILDLLTTEYNKDLSPNVLQLDVILHSLPNYD
ncbi:hypothetical protein CsatA_003872 [Cannabis sativa]